MCGYVCVHGGACLDAGLYVCMCVFGLQVPMVGKGVVDVMLATLAAVQGGGAQALPVQHAACNTLRNLARAADNKVR